MLFHSSKLVEPNKLYGENDKIVIYYHEFNCFRTGTIWINWAEHKCCVKAGGILLSHFDF